MVAGCSFVNRFLHTCLIKLDADGKTLWSRIYGDGLHACARSIEETSDRGYVIVGNEHGCGNGHSGVYAMKVDSLGNLVWENSSCECVMAEARSVKRAPDGGYVMMGSASSHEGASIDMLVRKIDEGGKTQWEKYYGGREDERGAALDVADGGYILAGNKIQKSGKSNICLTKTDLFGEVVWERTYEQPENAWSGSVRRTSDGGYVVVGNNRSLGSDLGEVFLMKTSRIGQVIWQRSLDKAAEGAGKSVEETSDGGFIITGSTASFSNGKESVCLVKTDSSGCVGQPNAK
jgi:outer membrane protein assembly factor BamB